MVGDSLTHDVDGAIRLGMRGVLVARSGQSTAPPDVPVIRVPPRVAGAAVKVRRQPAMPSCRPLDSVLGSAYARLLCEQVCLPGFAGEEEVDDAEAAREIRLKDLSRGHPPRERKLGPTGLHLAEARRISTSNRRAPSASTSASPGSSHSSPIWKRSCGVTPTRKTSSRRRSLSCRSTWRDSARGV